MARTSYGRLPADQWTEDEWAGEDPYPAGSGGTDAYAPEPYGTEDPGPRADQQPQRRRSEAHPWSKRVDRWMDQDFKFGGSRVKRKTIGLLLCGIPGVLPVFFMLPSVITLNVNTISGSGDDTLGEGALMCLFLCLLVTPMVTITGMRWFVPLRKWFGIMTAVAGIQDGIGAGITDKFAGGFFGNLTGHVFELMGFLMLMLLIPLLLLSNSFSQKKLGRFWKPIQRLTYVIWGILGLHLMLLEGFGFQSGTNGSGNPGDGDPIFHSRLYQYLGCSLFLLLFRLPPVKRWITAREQEGRQWMVWAAVVPVFALFVFAFTFVVNEEIFKGLDSFHELPSAE